MKTKITKIVCAAVVAVIAATVAVVAAAQGSGENNNSIVQNFPETDPCINTSNYDDINESSIEEKSTGLAKEDSVVSVDENDKISATNDNSNVTETDEEIVKNGEIDISIPCENVMVSSETENDRTSAVFEVVDPVDDTVRRMVDFSDTQVKYSRIPVLYEYDPKIDDSVVSLEYLKDFFVTDILPFDKEYKNNLKRVAYYAAYDCKVSEGTNAYSPVDGKVLAINDDYLYHNGLGKAVAVGFEDKVFILAHLDEVNVKVGDDVSAGQAVGVCGTTGSVLVGDGTVLSIVTMKIVSD